MYKKTNNPTIYFYNLSDPETNEVCYIGQTVSPLQRLSNHVYQVSGNYYKDLWISNLSQIGLSPVMTIIQERKISEINHWHHERKLVEFYWRSDQPLLNSGIRGRLCTLL